MKKVVLNLLMFLTVSGSFSQKLSYRGVPDNQMGEYTKVNFSNQNNNNVSYSYDGQTKLKVTIEDANFKKVANFVVKFNLKKIFIGIKYNKNGIFVFYENENEVMVEQFDYLGNTVKSVKLMDKPEFKQFKTGQKKFIHKISTSKNESYFVVGQCLETGLPIRNDEKNSSNFERYEYSKGFAAEKVVVIDSDLKQISKYACESKTKIDFNSLAISNQGILYFLEFSPNTNLVKLENNTPTKVSFKINQVGFMKLYMKCFDDKLLVTTIKSVIGNDPRNNFITRFAAQSVNYQLFNSKDLTSVYDLTYNFSKEEILKSQTADEAKDEHNSVGITGLCLSDVNLVNGNEIVATYYQDWEWYNNMVIKFSTIYLQKVSAKGVEKSVVIDRVDPKMDWYNMSSYEPALLTQNNKIYVCYLKNSLEEFGYKEFDMALKETKSKFENLVKLKSKMVYPDSFYKLSDKKIVFLSDGGEWYLEF